jgi:drug/metabolite transporter (DMT)-like permease
MPACAPGCRTLFGSALPFVLIAWGLQSVDSGLAGILMTVMPLATLSLSHFFVPGERLTPFRVTGFAFGFVGVTVIMGLESLESLSKHCEELLPMCEEVHHMRDAGLRVGTRIDPVGRVLRGLVGAGSSLGVSLARRI